MNLGHAPKTIFALGIFILLFAILGCEKQIDLVVADIPEQLVVEGYIYNRPGPYYVRVTRSATNYFKPNEFNGVSNALVVVSDNYGQIDTLKEAEPGLYETTKLQGIANRKYNLYVRTPQNEVATAWSYMPHDIDLSGLFTKYVGKDEATALYAEGYYVLLYGQDPDTLGNNYRVLFYKNDTLQNKPIDYFVWDDSFINGKLLVQPLFYTLQKGDTARVELWSMDKQSLDYYVTLVRQLTAGGPFSPPGGNVSGNVKGALGYFGANSTSIKQVIIE